MKAIFKVLLQFSRKRNKTLLLLVVLAIIAFNHSTIVRWMVVTSSGVSNAIIESYDRSERHKAGYKVAEKVRRVCNNFLVNAALPYPPRFLAAPINNQGPMPYSLLLPQKQESVRSLPNPRLVSETLFKRVNFIPNEEGLSALLAFFANFVIESLFDTQSGAPGIIVFNKTQIPYAKPTGYNLATPRIDLGPIYARSDKLRSFKNGKMLMQTITVKGIAQDFPPYLNTIRNKYAGFEMDNPLKKPDNKLFATGQRRGNLHPIMMTFITLFLRQHNRVCDRLKGQYPDFSDEQLFQTAQKILLVQFEKIVIQNYVGEHLARTDNVKDFSPKDYKFSRGFLMPFELNVAYQWHSMIPDSIPIGSQIYTLQDLSYNIDPLLKWGPEALLEGLSKTPAGRIGPYNTPRFLRNGDIGKHRKLDVEAIFIQKCRDLRLASFNDYREHIFGLERIKKWEQFSSDKRVQKDLASLYETPDQVDFYVGAIVSDRLYGNPIPEVVKKTFYMIIFRLVWGDPLITDYLNEYNFTKDGLGLIKDVSALKLLGKNINRKVDYIGFRLEGMQTK